jgi:hypothetical protein
MKHTIDFDHRSTLRSDLVIFSKWYPPAADTIKGFLSTGLVVNLRLARISDTGTIVSPVTYFFGAVRISDDQYECMYYDDFCDEVGEKISRKKILRFDNPLGEIPVFESVVECSHFFSVGEKFLAYKKFLSMVRIALRASIGEDVSLYYKNDDGTMSIIHTTILEVNKGNIFCDDFHERHEGSDGSTITAVIPVHRKMHHRFISQHGFLCAIRPPFFTRKSVHDDGLVGTMKSSV